MSLKNLIPGRLGFGTAPLGNMFRAIPEAEAQATVDAAWQDGIRFFDTAPFYGAGLAEARLGDVLAGRDRDSLVLATKVGRLVLDEVEDVTARDLGEKGDVFRHGRANRIVNDYSEAATLRSAGHRVGARRGAGLLRRRVAWRVRDCTQGRLQGAGPPAR